MTPKHPKQLRVAMVGGDRRIHPPGVRSFPSRGDAGRRGIRDVVRCIKQRTVDQVLLLVRWIGHSDVDVVKRACRAHDVPCVLVPGGASMAIALLERIHD